MPRKIKKGFSICGVNLGKFFNYSINFIPNCTIFVLLGDVESNPGPFWKKGDDPIENLQNIIDDQADDIKDLRDTIDNQNDVIDELKNKINEVTNRLSELSEDEDKTKENTDKCERMIESLQKDSDRNFERFSENDSKFGQELLQQKVIC